MYPIRGRFQSTTKAESAHLLICDKNSIWKSHGRPVDDPVSTGATRNMGKPCSYNMAEIGMAMIDYHIISSYTLHVRSKLVWLSLNVIRCGS